MSEKKQPVSLQERISRYLSRVPGAVSGQEGHTQTMKVAMVLYNGFGLSEADTLYWLTQYNPRCNPPWDEKALKHKASEAAAFKGYDLARGHLLKNGEAVRDEVIRNIPCRPPEKQRIDPTNCIENFLRGFRCNEHEIYEASPIKPSDDFTEDGLILVEHLFQPGEIVNFVTQFKMSPHRDGMEKAVPNGYGESIERDSLLLRWSLGMPKSEAGGWMRMNPTDGEGISDANITAFRHILLEFDNIPLELQLSLFAKLPLPISAILTSGGKSVHAWVRADALDVTNYKDTSAMLLKILDRFGLDGKNKNPSRLSRLPGVTRLLGASGDGRQRLLYISPKPEQKAIL